MSLWDRLFGKPNFHKFDDCYAIDRERLWLPLAKAIQSQIAQRKLVILICHFPKTFSAIQEQLLLSGIDYEIPCQSLDTSRLTDFATREEPSVLLVLSDLIENTASLKSRQLSYPRLETAILVCERHPLRKNDHKLEEFGKSLPSRVQLGYFLALQDALIKLAVNQMTYQLLIQMGVEHQDLFSSRLVTRRLNKVLERIEKRVRSEIPADSAEEWLENNFVS